MDSHAKPCQHRLWHFHLLALVDALAQSFLVAQALVDRITQGGVTVPIVARLVGTNAAEGRHLLTGSAVILATTMSEAAERVVCLAREPGRY